MMRSLHQLRVVALLEGTSFILLLFVAVPLKYVADMPLGVRVIGGLHGLLFLLFIAALYRASMEHGWPWRRSLLAFIASVLPFGAFVLAHSLRQEVLTESPTGQPALEQSAPEASAVD